MFKRASYTVLGAATGEEALRLLERHEERLAPLVEIIEVVQRIQASRDPDDDKFLEVATNGRADVVVSDDRDLLDLNPFRGIAILAPADYLARQTTDGT